jgi:hypothetical protein
MIKVSLAEMIVLIASLGLVSVVVAWLFSVLGTRNREVKRRRGVIRCRVCQTPNETRPADDI